jgi:hypothetical protein
MVRRTAPALITAALMVACGGGGGSTTSKASPSPTISAARSTPTARVGGSPTPIAGLCADQLTGSAPLIAVVEAKGSSTTGTGVSFTDSHDTLAIAGLDAVARARSTFAPRAHPYIGNAATVLSPNEAYVVHGTAYFIDGFGTVFSMGADGVQRTAARFPIGLDQQEVSFAVSPDGCQLVASVLTIPPKGPAPAGGGFPTLNGTWKLQTMKARVGGQTQLLHSWSSTSSPDTQGSSFKNLVLVGWDSTGPLVVVSSALGMQNLPYLVLNPDFISGTIAHLAADGTPGTPVPLPGCSGIQVSSAGSITCYVSSADGQSATVSVVDSTGAVRVKGFPITGSTEIAVGPDNLVALTGQFRGPNLVGTLPANFHPEGWVDVNTIFGRLSDPSNGIGDAALAHLSGSQATIEDLKFKGDFVSSLS